MTRYVAFLRGVSPMNAKMPELKACYEKMGFTDVRTLLSSGNVVFSSAKKKESVLAKILEDGMAQHMARSFPVIIRTTDYLRAMLESDPYAGFQISSQAKRIVTFLMDPPSEGIKLPIERDGAGILMANGHEVFSAYIPNARGPIFMTLIEKTFGKRVTTRTWDTVRKCAAA